MDRFLKATYTAFRPLIATARAHPLVVRRLFEIAVPPHMPVSYDTTTIGLRLTLPTWLQGRKKVLELGTGTAALLAAFAARRQGMAVDAVDLSPTRVESARRVVEDNKLPVSVWQSDLFENVPDRYDLIFFNPPYVPTSVGQDLDLTRRGGFDSTAVWDGGSDGTAVMQRVLRESDHHLSRSGVLLLGAQTLYIDDDKIQRIIPGSKMRLVRTQRYPFLKCAVWAFERRP